MKGGHDLGGQVDMGPINPEAENEEPVFHAEWERQVFGLTLATGMLDKWNIDESRHARERQNPLTYIRNSYYENWLEGLEKLLVEKGLISAAELKGLGTAGQLQAAAQLRGLNSEEAQKILSGGAPSLMEAESDPVFRTGDSVLVRQSESSAHTRVPRYAQGAVGIVTALLGCHSYPDSNARGIHEGKHLYTVTFQGSALWGSQSDNTEVAIDLWEPYIQQANS